MTANTSIITEQKEKVLRISNAALRFKMPNTNSVAKNESANPSRGSGATGSSPASAPMMGKPSAIRDVKVTTRKVWVLEKSGLKEKPVQKTIRVGLSDGNASEVLPGEDAAATLQIGDLVIIGVSGGAGKAGASRPSGPRLF
jgi:HlyD family secretion protein